MDYKCLSIRNPWLELILQRKKTIEIRTWKPKFKLPARILLHAGKKPDSWAVEHFGMKDFELGKICGVADLVEIVEYSTKERWDADVDKHLNLPEWFAPVQFGFVFENVARFSNPKEYKGKLNFFRLTLEGEV